MTTASDIKLALRRVYSQPEWALLFEVGDATGARHTRFADAIAMSLWPSRGLTLTGIEIKISRSDWKKERDQPEKAETIAAFCDYWQLVTAPKVVLDLTEVPPAWGLLEYNGEKFVTRKLPEKTEAKPITRQFLAALLRRAHKADDAIVEAAVKSRMEQYEAGFNTRVEMAADRKAGLRDDLIRQVAEFEEASGIKITGRTWTDPSAKEIGRAAKAVVASGVDRSYDSLHDLAKKLRSMSDDIEKAMLDLHLPPAAPSLSDFARKRSR